MTITVVVRWQNNKLGETLKQKGKNAMNNLHKQTATLIGRIAQNLPNMRTRGMQTLIDDPKALQRALRKGLCPDRQMLVKTNGRSGEQFILDLEKGRYDIPDITKPLLRDPRFIATDGVLYELAIIMGDEFESNEARANSKIRRIAYDRGYHAPPLEVAPYLREMLSDLFLETMGLKALIVMHEPIDGADGRSYLLGVDRSGNGRRLSYDCGEPSEKWNSNIGFVFQVRIIKPNVVLK